MTPTIRGSQLLAKVKSIDAQGPAFAEPVWRALPGGTETALRQASRADWLPMHHDVALNHALWDHHGEEGVREVCRDTTLRGLQGPLLGALATGAMRLFGQKPGRFYSLVPRGWTQVYRGGGEVSVEEQTPLPRARLRYQGLAPGFFERGYLEAIAGGLEALLAFMQIAGEVTVESRAPEAKEATLIARWALESAAS